jgi:hypothetical protein
VNEGDAAGADSDSKRLVIDLLGDVKKSAKGETYGI